MKIDPERLWDELKKAVADEEETARRIIESRGTKIEEANFERRIAAVHAIQTAGLKAAVMHGAALCIGLVLGVMNAIEELQQESKR